MASSLSAHPSVAGFGAPKPGIPPRAALALGAPREPRRPASRIHLVARVAAVSGEAQLK